MAAHELVVDPPRGLLEVTGAALLEEQGKEVDLKEEVAQLVEQLGVVVRECSVRHLVCLLDGVRNDRARGLLAVPGTVAA